MELSLNAYQMVLFLITAALMVIVAALAWKNHFRSAFGIAVVWFVIAVFLPVKTVAPSHGDREAPASFDKAFTAPVPPADTRSLKQQNEDEYEALKAQSKEVENEINR